MGLLIGERVGFASKSDVELQVVYDAVDFDKMRRSHCDCIVAVLQARCSLEIILCR